MEIKNRFDIVVGDQYNDGHGMCDKIAVLISCEREEAMEAYNKFVRTSKVCLHHSAGYPHKYFIDDEEGRKILPKEDRELSILSDYEENFFDRDVLVRMAEAGLRADHLEELGYLEEYYKDKNVVCVVDEQGAAVLYLEMIRAGMGLLNKSFEYELIKESVPQLNPFNIGYGMYYG